MNMASPGVLRTEATRAEALAAAATAGGLKREHLGRQQPQQLEQQQH